jgi:hypothetical protein
VSEEIIDFSEMAESFLVNHNKDYSTTVLMIAKLPRLLEATMKVREHLVQAEKQSSSSQEEIARPCYERHFSTPDKALEVKLGLQLNPIESRRRGHSSDFLLTVFYQVTSKKPSLDGTRIIRRTKNILPFESDF